MAGPDGVVYVVTPAGAVPVTRTTVPTAHMTPPRESAPQSKHGNVGPCFSYPPDGVVSPCFSYTPDLPRNGDADASGEALGSLPEVPGTACFSYSPNPAASRHDAGGRALGSLRRMPGGMCFGFYANPPPGISNRRATQRGLPWVRRMPNINCFSYSADLPGEIGPCFSY